jgi:hypothetical protein
MITSQLLKSTRLHLPRLPRHALSTTPDYLPFDTLHSLNANAVEKYPSNPLFGTFRGSKDGFEWMTYAEFGRRVELCRGLLREVGEFSFDVFVTT